MPVAADEDLDGEDRQVVKRPRADLHMEKAPEMAAVEAPVNYTELHNAVCTATDDNIKLKDKVQILIHVVFVVIGSFVEVILKL